MKKSNQKEKLKFCNVSRSFENMYDVCYIFMIRVFIKLCYQGKLYSHKDLFHHKCTTVEWICIILCLNKPDKNSIDNNCHM